MTKHIISILTFLAFSLIGCAKSPVPDEGSQDGGSDSELTVTWDKTNTVTWKGGYARVHPLADGSLMAVYASGGNACYRKSKDNGKTWGNQEVAMEKVEYNIDSETITGNIANSEFAQLSATNPHHPGRIIYAGNIRPSDNRSDVVPYSICYATSDDGGRSWSSLQTAYKSALWERPELVGCWEPFVLELPNGKVQIYFADETPYFRTGSKYQNISVVESNDGGDSWGKARVVAYTEKCRDGMPVVMLYEDNIYLAIEHFTSGEKLHPQIVYSSIKDNWKKAVLVNSPYRFDPMAKPFDYKNEYFGAPYLVATDNYIVLSYQSSVGAQVKDSSHAVMGVVVCHKNDVKDGKFDSMRAASRPVDVNQETSCARWNSLCPLGGDEILAVSDVNGIIVLTRGRITGK